MKLAAVVEGHGDVKALPILLRRLAEIEGCKANVVKVVRKAKSELLQPGNLEKVIEYLADFVRPSGSVLVLLDADKDCPAVHGPKILQRAREAARDCDVSAVLANREFEAWFVGALESLRGFRGISSSAMPHAAPETLASPKAFLSNAMGPNRRYGETVDQPAMAELFDIIQARAKCPSLSKLARDFVRLCRKEAQVN